MKNTNYIYLLLISLLISCTNESKYENALTFSSADFGDPIQLTSEIIEFDEPVMFPGKILLVDSILLIGNLKTERLLYRYNIFTKKKTGEYISFGSGPDELLRIKDIQKIDSSIFISDNQKRVVFEYNTYDLCYNKDPRLIKSTTINEAINSLQRIPEGYVCTTMNPLNKRFIFFNHEGNSIYSEGEFPSHGEEINKIEIVNSYINQMVVNPHLQYIYIFYMQTDLIEIYNFKGEFVKRLHGPDHFFPHIKEKQLEGGFSRISPIYGEAREAYYSPIVVDNEVYVLYSGAFREKKPAPLNMILVFSAEGNPLRKYILSEPIITFTIDPISKDIYATSEIPDYHIVKFKNKIN